MVLHTTFTTASGTVRLGDALALETGARGHDIGLRSPHVGLITAAWAINEATQRKEASR